MELGKSIGDCLIQVFAEMDSALVDKGLSELQLSLKQASDLSNYLWILKTKTVLLVEQMAEAVSQRESYPIYAAKQYIQQNFSRQINLAEVAECKKIVEAAGIHNRPGCRNGGISGCQIFQQDL